LNTNVDGLFTFIEQSDIVASVSAVNGCTSVSTLSDIAFMSCHYY